MSEICVRGCVMASESSPAGPADRGPLPSLATKLRVPSPSRKHFHLPTFLLRVGPAGAWISLSLMPNRFHSYLNGQKQSSRWSLLYGKQVTFRFSRIRLSSRFFGHSLRLRHRCLLERNFLERKIIKYIFRIYLYNKRIDRR